MSIQVVANPDLTARVLKSAARIGATFPFDQQDRAFVQAVGALSTVVHGTAEAMKTLVAPKYDLSARPLALEQQSLSVSLQEEHEKLFSALARQAALDDPDTAVVSSSSL